jgi:hypothetical protein
MDMNGLSTKDELNVFPLAFYDCLIEMDLLEQHHTILDYHKKEFTFLDEEGNQKNIPRNSQSCGYPRNLSNAIEEVLQKRLSIIYNPCGGNI